MKIKKTHLIPVNVKSLYNKIGVKLLSRYIAVFIILIVLNFAFQTFAQEKTEIHVQLGHSSLVDSVSFSLDGKYALSGSNDKTLKLWDISTGKEIRTFTGHSVGVSSVSFSPDGKYALSGSWDKTLKLWDVSTGKEIRTFTGHSSGVESVSFSPDGKSALSGSDDKTLKLWDVASGKEIRTFTGHSASVNSVGFSPDGKSVLSGSWDKTLKLWDVETGKEIRKFTGHSDGVTSVSFSPDGKTALSGCRDHTLKLWDVETGKELRTFTGHSGFVTSVSFSPDGKSVLSGSYDNTVKLWDMSTGKEIRKFTGHSTEVFSVTFSPDGKYALSGSNDSTLKLWDIKTGKEIRTFTGHSGGVFSVTFSPDGRYALSGSEDKTLKLWDVDTGKEIRTFTGHSSWVDSVTFSPDGRYALSGSNEKTLKLWDVDTGKEIRTFTGHSSWVNSVSFSPDGKYALSGSGDKTLKLWDVASGKEIRTFTGHSGYVSSVTFSPDGRYALSGSWDNTLKLWDVSTGKEIRTFKGHSYSVSSVTFSPDGRYALSGSSDTTIKLWEVKSGQNVTLASAGDEWLMYTDDGYFDASRNGGELVAMVQGLTPFGIDQFAIKNNRPDIILKRMGLGSEEIIAHFYAQYQKRLKKAGFTEEQLSSELHVPEAKILETKQDGKFVDVNFKLSDSKYNLKKYNIYVNDVPLFGAYGKEITGTELTKTERIELTSGTNKIEVSCINEKGAESYRALTYADYNEKVKGDLYFIGFGVSNYKNTDLNLKYADKDVKDLAELFSGMKGQYENVYVKTFLNEDVTVENIKQAKELLKDAKVDDTFVLFIAGHGVYDRTNEATYYYLTYNTDLDNLSQTAADFDLIEDLLQGIAPRDKLFLMDTCESGEVDEQEQEQYFTLADSRGIKPRTTRSVILVSKSKGPKRTYLYQKDRYIYNDLSRRSGAIVFSSSKGGEFSYESDKIQNGFFTKAIMQSMTTQQADKNGDGVISTDELRDYVSTTVPQMTENQQHPTVDRDNLFVKFGFPFILNGESLEPPGTVKAETKTEVKEEKKETPVEGTEIKKEVKEEKKEMSQPAMEQALPLEITAINPKSVQFSLQGECNLQVGDIVNVIRGGKIIARLKISKASGDTLNADILEVTAGKEIDFDDIIVKEK